MSRFLYHPKNFLPGSLYSARLQRANAVSHPSPSPLSLANKERPNGRGRGFWKFFGSLGLPHIITHFYKFGPPGDNLLQTITSVFPPYVYLPPPRCIPAITKDYNFVFSARVTIDYKTFDTLRDLRYSYYIGGEELKGIKIIHHRLYKTEIGLLLHCGLDTHKGDRNAEGYW